MIEDLGFVSGDPAPVDGATPGLTRKPPDSAYRTEGAMKTSGVVMFTPAEEADVVRQERVFADAPGAREDFIKEIDRAKRDPDPRKSAMKVAVLEDEFQKVYGESAGLTRVGAQAEPAPKKVAATPAPKAKGGGRFEDVGWQHYEAPGGPTVEEGTRASDYVKAAGAGALQGAGMIAQGGGELAARASNAVLGTDLRSGNPLQPAVDWLNDSQSDAAKKAMAESQISGDITDPTSWDWGSNPTFKGIALQGLNAVGQFAPNLAIAMGTAGASVPAQLAVGATVGGLQALGGGAEDERTAINKMGHAELMASSDLYREFIAKGVDQDTAKKATAEAAALGGGIGNALPSAAEGAFENFLLGAIFKGKFKIPGKLGSSFAGRLATGAVGGGAMGGAEEAIEQVGQNIGSNVAIGGNRSPTKDTLQQFVMGMIAEGSAGSLTAPFTGKPSAAALPRAGGENREPVPASDVLGATEAPAARRPDVSGLGQEQKAALQPGAGTTPLERHAAIERELAALDPAQPDAQVRAAALTAERDDIAATFPQMHAGAGTSFSTESGVKLDGHFALAELGDLTASHSTTMQENPAFPAELQPRDRTAAAYQVQVAKIAHNLNPERLGVSPTVAEGAPIVGADGVVESGNGRVIALQRVYDDRPDQAKAYRDYLEQNAAAFGLSPEQIQEMNQPVLVRVRDTPVDRAEFARQANAPTTAQLSPIDAARSDAARMGSLEGLQIPENGDMNVPANDPIIKGFFRGLPINEQVGLVDPDGRISQAGYRRFVNAMMVRAYGGKSGAIMRIVETLNPDLKSLSNALVRVAPLIAKARDTIQKTKLAELDISDDLVAAADQLVQLKADKMSVADMLAQSAMFPTVNETTLELLKFLEDNLGAPKRIADFIETYLNELDALGNLDQGTMFGAPAVPTRDELLAKTKGTLTNEAAKLAGTIPAKPAAGGEAVASGQGAETEPHPAAVSGSLELVDQGESKPDHAAARGEVAGARDEPAPAEGVKPKPVAKPKAAPVDKLKVAESKLQAKKKPASKVPAKKPVAAAVEKGFGESNKIFTKERADAARALLKRKGAQLNVGIDPETMQAGIDLAGYYIESGARSFAAYSAKMLADLGDEFKPFFKTFYLAVRNWPGFDKTGMQSEIEVEAELLAAIKAPKPSLMNKEPPGGWTDKVPEKYRKKAAPEIVATYPSVEGTEIHVIKNQQGYVVNIMDTDAGQYMPTLRQFTGDGALEKANEYAVSIQKKADPAPAPKDLTFGFKFPAGYKIERNENGDVVFSGPPDDGVIGIVAAGADYDKDTAAAWHKIATAPPAEATRLIAQLDALGYDVALNGEGGLEVITRRPADRRRNGESFSLDEKRGEFFGLGENFNETSPPANVNALAVRLHNAIESATTAPAHATATAAVKADAKKLKGDKNAIKTGKQSGDSEQKHSGTTPRRDLFADTGEVRAEESKQAGGGDRVEGGGAAKKTIAQASDLIPDDVAGLTIRIPVIVAETGEKVFIERNAKDALTESKQQVARLEALKRCVNA